MTSGRGHELSQSPLAAARGGLDLCVHCGFCLQACPTYITLEDENDSPRGRIVLMHALLDGDVAPTDNALQEHISRCLGCRACETACPSGVPFGQLLEATRATLNEYKRPPLVARVMLAVFANPVFLRPVMALARVIRKSGVAAALSKAPGRMGRAFAMLAASAPGPFSRTAAPSATPATGAGDAAALFEGCVMRELYSHIHYATQGALARNSYTNINVAGQGCCGALHAHSGDLIKARALAKRNIEAFEQHPSAVVAVNAAGCGAMLKEYPHLLSDEPAWSGRAHSFAERVFDISELLAARGPAQSGPIELNVSYDPPCHLQHAQRITNPPLAMFNAIPGLQLSVSADADKCCGAAGIYNLLQPELSEGVLAPKMGDLYRQNSQVVCTGNPGCMMQIGAALQQSDSTMKVAHPVEILDYAYRASTQPK